MNLVLTLSQELNNLEAADHMHGGEASVMSSVSKLDEIV
jgi:hypothetical protein